MKEKRKAGIKVDKLEEKLNQIMNLTVPKSLQNDSKTKTSEICPLCNNTYWIINDDGAAKRCQCFEKEKQRRRLSFANMPSGFLDYKLSNFTLKVYQQEKSKEEIKGVVQLIKAYLETLEKQLENGKGFYLYSSTKGSGKTRLMASVANELMEKYEKQVRFCTSIAIINEIKKTWGNKVDYPESKLVDDLINTEILVIDDFGTEKRNEHFEDRFYYIINERYINKRATFYTSNYDLENLDYDERITNRMKECCYQLHFPEESIREHIAKENITNLLGGQ